MAYNLQKGINFESQFQETLYQAVSSFSIKQYNQIVLGFTYIPRLALHEPESNACYEKLTEKTMDPTNHSFMMHSVAVPCVDTFLDYEESETWGQHFSEDILFMVRLLDVEIQEAPKLKLQDLERILLQSETFLESILLDRGVEHEPCNVLEDAFGSELFDIRQPECNSFVHQSNYLDLNLPSMTMPFESMLEANFQKHQGEIAVLDNVPVTMSTFEIGLGVEETKDSIDSFAFCHLSTWPLYCPTHSYMLFPFADSLNGPRCFQQSFALMPFEFQSCLSSLYQVDLFSLEIADDLLSNSLIVGDRLRLPHQECLVLDGEEHVDRLEGNDSDDLFEIRDKDESTEASASSFQKGIFTNIDSFMKLRNKKVDTGASKVVSSVPPSLLSLSPPEKTMVAQPPLTVPESVSLSLSLAHGPPTKPWLPKVSQPLTVSNGLSAPIRSNFVIISSQPLPEHSDLIESLTLMIHGLLITSLASSVSNSTSASAYLPVLSLAVSTCVILIPTCSLFIASEECQSMNDVYRLQLENLIQFLVHLSLQYSHVHLVFEFYAPNNKSVELSKLVLDFIYDLISEMIPHLQSVADASFHAFYSFSSEQTAKRIQELSCIIAEHELVTVEEYEMVIENRYQKYMYLSCIPFFNPSKILKSLFQSSLLSLLQEEDSFSDILKTYLQYEI